MHHRHIGGLSASIVGLGCNNFGMRIDEAATRAVVDAALDAGVTFFDTANIYGGSKSEEFLGRALAGRRNKVVLASKFGMKETDGAEGAAPAYVKSAVEASLRRLNTEFLDLYQLHTPDPSTPIADTMGALDDLVQAGKVLEIGCSNFSPDQLREAEKAAQHGTRFVSVQNQYSLLHRDPESGVLDACRELDLAFLPYFPLAGGLLTGKYGADKPHPDGTRLAPDNPRLTEQNLAAADRLDGFAGDHGHTLLELAFAWLLAHAEVASVIAGATKPEQVRANARAAEWRLSSDDLKTIDALLQGAAV